MPGTEFRHPQEPDAVIICLGDYLPWSWHKAMGGDSRTYPQYSGQILDLKQSKAASLKAFEDLVVGGMSKQYHAICSVPSHDPSKPQDSGIGLLAKRIASRMGIVDGRKYLQRTHKIDKLASGGDRSISVHMGSLAAQHHGEFFLERILLIDDVLTTGNSLVAARRVLLAAGAGEVICVALAHTKH